VKNNEHAFSAKVVEIHEEDTIENEKFKWITVKILQFCNLYAEKTIIQTIKILVPTHACKADELAVGKEFTFFGQWKMIRGVKVVIVAKCGITYFDWNDVDKLCNPCKDCSQDLLWLVKNNEHAFSAKVVEIHEEDTIENEKFKWITVKILQFCNLYAEKTIIQTIKILVPTHACKADELAVGKEFTFFGQWKMIRGVKVVIVAKCGITHFDWHSVAKYCDNNHGHKCPIVVIRPDGSECLCKNEARHVCAVHGESGFEKTFINACVAKCTPGYDIVCAAPCHHCERICSWD